MITANARFHNYITELSQNSTLIRMITQLKIRFHIFNTFAWSSPEIVECILKEHEQYDYQINVAAIADRFSPAEETKSANHPPPTGTGKCFID